MKTVEKNKIMKEVKEKYETDEWKENEINERDALLNNFKEEIYFFK